MPIARWASAAAPGLAARDRLTRLAWSVLLLASLLLAAPAVQYLGQGGQDPVRLAAEDFSYGLIRLPGTHVEVSGFATDNDGYTLAPGTSGRVLYRVEKPPGTDLSAQLWFYDSPGTLTNRVAVAVDGGPEVELALDRNFNGDQLQLPGSVRSATTVDFVFTAANSGAADRLVLDEFNWSATHGAPVGPPSPWFSVGLGLLAALLAFALRRPPAGIAGAVALGIVVAISAMPRFQQLHVLAARQLDPDAITYRAFADRFRYWPLSQGLFCGCYSMREPLYMLLIRAWFDLIGETAFHLRVLSTLFSLSVPALAVVAAARRLRWGTAIAIGTVLALNGPLVDESARGLRTELETVELLLLYLATDRGPALRPVRESILTGILAAAGALTRTYYVAMLGVVALVSFTSRYRPLHRGIALAAIVVVLMAGAEAGHRWGMYRATHDVQYDSFVEGRSWANIEHFDYHRDLLRPDLMPSAEEVASQGYLAGPYLTYGQYLLLMHPVGEVVLYTAAGYLDILTAFDGFLRLPDIRLPPPFGGGGLLGTMVDFLARWLGIGGLVWMLVAAIRRPQLAIVPIMVGSSVVVQAFLYHLGMLERYRLTIEVYPLMLVAAGWAAETGLARLGHPIEELARRGGAWLRRRFSVALVAAPVAAGAAAAAINSATAGPRLQALLAASLLALAVAAWLEPAWGLLAIAGTVSVAGDRLAAAAAAIGAALVLARLREWRAARVAALAAGPAVALAVAAAMHSGAGLRSALPVVTVFAAMGAVAVFAASAARRAVAVEALAAASIPLSLLSFSVAGTQPSSGGLTLLAPAVAAAVLAPAAWAACARALGAPSPARRAIATWALAGVAVSLSGPAILATGVAIAVLVAARARPAPRPLTAAVAAAAAVLTLLGAVLVALPGRTQAAPWRTYLADPAASITQEVPVHDRPSRVWVFGRRTGPAGAFAIDLHAGSAVVDLVPVLDGGALAWHSVPVEGLPGSGDLRLEITVSQGVDPALDYVEIGGTYSHFPGAVSRLDGPGRSAGDDLSPDAGLQSGTFLVLPGDASGPWLPPGFVAPAPALPLAPPPPVGETSASPAAAATAQLDIVRVALQTAASRPLGVGPGRFSDASIDSRAGLAPGTTARSQVLQYAAELGPLGAAALLLALGVAALPLRRRNPGGDRAILGALWAGSAVLLLTESVFADPHAAAGVAVALGLCIGAAASRPAAGGGDR